ncbi:hypothetical protein M514_02949 [Trichuris suis]|uniref:Core Histone H2A/H2B/H3 domain-containing protein n=1 Tax=Trichuris suis TaxID=68888 RepID=A0A085MG25_9BILA|nr:hypothetical protein M513_02949 [Trichuris suis]KFD69175.1 hypothetical protein M514_02949 [Trichuris suis]KHJ43893.1 core histone H2A/H2B/H3/H4 [Trichuris suis]
MLRRPVESPRSYSSSTSASGSRRAPERSLSGTFTPERSAEGTCTFSGPRLRAAIVRIPPERMQRLERVRRVLDRPHGVHTPGGGRLRGAYSGHSGSARATPPQQQGRARPPREYPPPPPPPSGSSGQRRRRRRMRPGERALREIKRYQLSTELLLAKAPFARVVRDVLCAIPTTVHRMTLLAVEALQEASEAFLIHVLEDAYLCTIHAKRKTLMLTDVRLACRLRNGYNL